MNIFKLNTIFAILYIILPLIQSDSSCRTPNLFIGTCISIMKCPPLFEMLLNRNRPRSHTNLLRDSRCGGKINNLPEVCCPNGYGATRDKLCYTPDRKIGSCISLFQCESALNLLSRDLNYQTANYLRKLSCRGSSFLSICCPSSLISPPRTLQSKINQYLDEYDDNTDDDQYDDSYNNKNDNNLYDDDLEGENTDYNTEEYKDYNSIPKESLLTSKCGGAIAEEHMGNDNEANIYGHPWIGIVMYKNWQNLLVMLCSATLITERYLLTAGHCLTGKIINYGQPYAVRLGDHDTRSDVDCRITADGSETCNTSPTQILIEDYLIHPGFEVKRRSTYINDVGLLRLQKQAPYTDFIRPICLPSMSSTKGWNEKSLKLVVSGWNLTEVAGSKSEVKLEIDANYLPLSECEGFSEYIGKHNASFGKNICANSISMDNSCLIDSGGPLITNTVQNQDGKVQRWELVGVESFGLTPCDRTIVPVIYTNISYYIPWILNSLQP